MTQTPFLLLGLSLAGFAAASKPIATFEELAMLRSAPIRITASSEDGHAIAGVGSNGCCTSQAFRWDGTGPVQRLVPPPGQADSFARAISADGQVVLVETRGQDPGRVYRWLPDGSLFALTSPDAAHSASAINSDGSLVAGTEFRPDEPDAEHAFLWSVKDGYRPLPVPGGVRSADPAFFSPDARTLHGVGYAVGAETGDVNVAVAVSWRDGRAQVHPPVLLQAAASSGDALLSREDVERMNLNMPFAHAADGVPMQNEWIGANADLVLGKDAASEVRLIWTRANGICRLTDWLDALGVAYPRDATLEAHLTSRDGSTLFGHSYRAADSEPVTPSRLVSQQPLGQIRASTSPYCGAPPP
ncbi:hypothetical protein [Stenotrophomonas maltophilia]|uniref:hypothetical protein n=1 Tax=Stenotrophomonas maltophilia TaxID=40324 RepID=UPI00166ADA79|nr:hypothetical protein [Stenotrophomonas maltophilia]